MFCFKTTKKHTKHKQTNIMGFVYVLCVFLRVFFVWFSCAPLCVVVLVALCVSVLLFVGLVICLCIICYLCVCDCCVSKQQRATEQQTN